MNKLGKSLSCVTSAMMILSLSTPVFAAGTGIATGTQKAYVTGDDWGCGVSKTIMTLDKTIDAKSVAATDFSVEEVVNGTTKSQRTIKAAYTSDAKGNKVTDDSNIVTVEMAISPSEGSPISWNQSAFKNSWANPYELNVSIVDGQDITSAGETIRELDVESKIDVAKDGKVCPQLDGFEISDFTDSEGGKTNYALYTPKKDSHKNALVIWNHGGGEYGTDVQIDLLANEVTAYAGEEFQSVMDGAYVLVPQRRNAEGQTTTKTVYELIQKVLKENPDIDPNRIIEGGCSAGGMFTLQLSLAYPDLFAATFPICPARSLTEEEAETIKDVPTWYTIALNDPTCPYETITKVALDSLKAVGAKEVHTSFFKDVHDTTGRFKNADGTPYQYSGHWSWIYVDNNECYDENGVNLWQWISKQSKEDTVVANGTQKAYVVGEDWGPAVTKTVIKLDKAIDADSVDANNLSVVEEKTSTNWATGEEYLAKADRKVTGAYTSDENGNQVSGSSNYLTIEMYVSPNEGSPFIYSLASGFNRWCDTYRLYVSLAKGAQLKADDEIVSELNVVADIDVAGDGKICPQLDQFDYAGKSYTTSDGTVYSYGEFTPAKDNKKNALVIWLHGAGEGGNSGVNDPSIDILGNEVTAFVGEEFQKELNNAYVVTPQCPTMWMDDGTGAYQNGDKGSCYKDSLMEFIKAYVAANDDIDPNKVIIGGCSNGGYMTMEMILANPDYFAAAFPICEAFQDQYITDEQINSIKDMGIWFTYAKNDPTVDPTKCSEPTIKRLLAAGAKNVHVSEFEDVHDTSGRFTDEDGNPYQYSGHWSWIYFDNNECYDENGVNAWTWLGQQAKVAAVEDAKKDETSKGNQITGTTTTSNKISSVKTGDNTSLAGYAMLFMAAAYGAIKLRRKEN